MGTRARTINSATTAAARPHALAVAVLAHLASLAALVAFAVYPGQTGAPDASDLLWGVVAGLGGALGALLLFRGFDTGSTSLTNTRDRFDRSTSVDLTGIDERGVIDAMERQFADEPEVVAPDAAPPDPTTPAPTFDATSDATPDSMPTDPTFARSFNELAAAARSHRDAFEAARLKRQRVEADTAIPDLFAERNRLPRRRRTVSPERRAGRRQALLGGIGITLFFVFIAQAASDAGHWPLVAARFVSVVLFAAIAIDRNTVILPARSACPASIGVGALDAVVAMCFVAVVQSGLLWIGVVLASTCVAAVVLLAQLNGMTKQRSASVPSAYRS